MTTGKIKIKTEAGYEEVVPALADKATKDADGNTITSTYATKTDIEGKSAVSVSDTGTATDVVNYITVDGTEKKIGDYDKNATTLDVCAGGSGGYPYGRIRCGGEMDGITPATLTAVKSADGTNTYWTATAGYATGTPAYQYKAVGNDMIVVNKRLTDYAQPKLTAGDNITISDDNVISTLSTNVFVATYETTTFSEITTAKEAGKMVVAVRDNTYYADMVAVVSPTDDTVVTDYLFLRPSAVGMEQCEYLDISSSGTWSFSTRDLPAQPKLTAGEGITISSDNVITASAFTANDLNINIDGTDGVPTCNITVGKDVTGYGGKPRIEIAEDIDDGGLTWHMTGGWKSGADPQFSAEGDSAVVVYKHLKTYAQPILTAGDNITIENNVISATGGGSSLIEGTDYLNPTHLSETYATKSEISSVYKVKGSCKYSELPSSSSVGDVWNITEAFAVDDVEYPAGTNVVWTDDGWDALAGTYDLSAYQPKLTAGDNITIVDNVISATGGGSGGSATWTLQSSPDTVWDTTNKTPLKEAQLCLSMDGTVTTLMLHPGVTYDGYIYIGSIQSSSSSSHATVWKLNCSGAPSTWVLYIYSSSSSSGASSSTSAVSWSSSPTSGNRWFTGTVSGSGGSVSKASVTLSASGWSSSTQTVSTGLTWTDSDVIMVDATPATKSIALDTGVYASAEDGTAGTITFTCSTVPTADVTVSVVKM